MDLDKKIKIMHKRNKMLDARYDYTLEKIQEMAILKNSYEILCKHNLRKEGKIKKEELSKQYTFARDEAMKGLTQTIIDTTEFNKYPKSL